MAKELPEVRIGEKGARVDQCLPPDLAVLLADAAGAGALADDAGDANDPGAAEPAGFAEEADADDAGDADDPGAADPASEGLVIEGAELAAPAAPVCCRSPASL